jgi:hypothetical protein
MNHFLRLRLGKSIELQNHEVIYLTDTKERQFNKSRQIRIKMIVLTKSLFIIVLDLFNLSSSELELGVADYGYDFNFIEDLKTYSHRTFNIFKIAFSYLDPATPRTLSCWWGRDKGPYQKSTSKRLGHPNKKPYNTTNWANSTECSPISSRFKNFFV